ncbi:putative pre-mRNA-splicing factor 38A [Plasmodium gaboni]|uniref:Pre-mRNA-splicing factor 38 n=1 Tax=Plasmodium gaboni TaxID=647221 RepID=A0A151LJ76_9APIC|nr:putative pre-mRNA-splicing factor 38A [Plasmodium gaboni]KYN98962.1 putative pre-mRNA-splicing factor 38A [Plasmodium gaboni]
MANRTDASAIKFFGSNPQYLISNIIRSKIYDSPYWKEKCFALTSESIIDQAINLKYVGGTYGGNRKPTRFLCLILKLLQIQPDKDIIYEYIKNEDFVYLRALGIFYLRLIGKSLEIYSHLEPILFDYRKIRMRLQNGTFEKIYMDVFVDNCLILNNFLDVDFPTLTKRQVLEENNLLERKNLEYYKVLLNISSDNELFQNKEDTHNKDKEEGSKNKNEYKQRDMLKRYKKFNKYSSEDDHNYHKKERNYDKDKKHNRMYNNKYNKYDEKEKHHHSDYSSDLDRKKKKKKTHSKYDYKKKKEKRKYSSDSKNSFTSSEYSVQNKKEEHDKKKKKKLFFLKKQKKKENYHSSSQSNDSYDEKKKERKKKMDNSFGDETKKDELSVDRWNEIRKELGMKPLK